MCGRPSKTERLHEFFQRLSNAGPVASFEEAYRLLCATLDQVEDDLSGLPNRPDQWMTSDRMFPPQEDRMSSVPESTVKRFDNLRHITYIAQNGAIEIRSRRLKAGQIEVHFSKDGADGRKICDVCVNLRSRNL